MAGIFDNLDEADVFENSAYFQPGRYIVAINACKFISGGHKGDSFVIEAKVLGVIPDAEYPAVYALAHDGNPPPPCPGVGALAAQVWSASGDKRDIARNTWLGFLCSAYGVDKEAYDGAQWKTISERVIGENALGGQTLALECFMKKTKVNRDFTMHAWRGTPTAETMAEFGLGA